MTQLAAVGVVIMIGFWISPGFGATLSQGLDVNLASTVLLSMTARLAAVRKWFSPAVRIRGQRPSRSFAPAAGRPGTPRCLRFVKTLGRSRAAFRRQMRDRSTTSQQRLNIVSI
jgi:hypothetical protein